VIGVGGICSLDDARERRRQRRLAAAEHAGWHPALRWLTPGSAPAHRRASDGGTACGESGPLTLASPGVDLCQDCYPARAYG
jgi:hypothetical protein